MRAITRRYVSLRDLLLTGLLLVVLSGSFLLLTGSTVNLSTVQWDEFTDLVIASRLSEHPLSGHTYDRSQARFPMYVTALAFLVGRATTPFSVACLNGPSRWTAIRICWRRPSTQ